METLSVTTEVVHDDAVDLRFRIHNSGWNDDANPHNIIGVAKRLPSRFLLLYIRLSMVSSAVVDQTPSCKGSHLPRFSYTCAAAFALFLSIL